MLSTRFIAATFAIIAVLLALLPVSKAAPGCAYFDFPKFKSSDPYPTYSDSQGPIGYTCNPQGNCIWIGFPKQICPLYIITLNFAVGYHGRVQLKNDGTGNAWCTAYDGHSDRHSVWFYVATGQDRQCTMDIPPGYNDWTLQCSWFE